MRPLVIWEEARNIKLATECGLDRGDIIYPGFLVLFSDSIISWFKLLVNLKKQYTTQVGNNRALYVEVCDY